MQKNIKFYKNTRLRKLIIDDIVLGVLHSNNDSLTEGFLSQPTEPPFFFFIENELSIYTKIEKWYETRIHLPVFIQFLQ